MRGIKGPTALLAAVAIAFAVTPAAEGTAPVPHTDQFLDKTEYALSGQTTAVDAPGTYQATIKCLTRSIVNTIRVPATPPPGPGPKPPIVKPKGAPDTGGGSTATR